MHRKAILSITLIISAVLFVLSLSFPSYCTSSGCLDAAVAFSTGWFGAFVELGTIGNWVTEQLSKHSDVLNAQEGAALTWLANPLLFISWIGILRWPRGSFIFSLLAMIVAFSFLLFDHVLHNDIGHYSKIVSVGTGYWLWISSMVVMVVGNTLIKFFLNGTVGVKTKLSERFIPE